MARTRFDRSDFISSPTPKTPDLIVADGSCLQIRQLLSTAEVPVLWLDDKEPPLENVSRALAERKLLMQPVAALHWVSHGSPGRLHIGASQINSNTLLVNAHHLASWGIGSPTSDSDSDGFTDGSQSSAYQLFNDGDPIDITNRAGGTYSDSSSSNWDAIKAVATDSGSGFQVLLEGTAARDDHFYVWTTNSSGVITRGSGWKTITQAHDLGWESIFGDLIQPDGIIGSPNP